MKRPEILSYFRMRTRDGDVAEDLTQELFIRLWLRKDKLGHVTCLTSYINRMARNLVIDHYDARNVHEKATKYIQTTFVLTTLDDRCEHLDAVAFAERVVSNLTPNEQMVFRMSCQEGDNVKGIAKRLNRNEFYVKRAVSKVKAKVRDHLRPLITYV